MRISRLLSLYARLCKQLKVWSEGAYESKKVGGHGGGEKENRYDCLKDDIMYGTPVWLTETNPKIKPTGQSSKLLGKL